MDAEELLAEWRAAGAMVEAAGPGSAERARAEAVAAEARLAYQRRVDSLDDIARDLAGAHGACLAIRDVGRCAGWHPVGQAIEPNGA